jgi:hypothetical protein
MTISDRLDKHSDPLIRMNLDLTRSYVMGADVELTAARTILRIFQKKQNGI